MRPDPAATPGGGALGSARDLALQPRRGRGRRSARRPGSPWGPRRLALIAVLAADLTALIAGAPGQVRLGTWLSSGEVVRSPSASPWTPWACAMATLMAVICLLTLRFSVHYMHREPGFRRFFMVLSPVHRGHAAHRHRRQRGARLRRLGAGRASARTC